MRMTTFSEVRNRVFAYIETYDNRKRIHTVLGMTPVEFKTECHQRTPSAEFSRASVAPSV